MKKADSTNLIERLESFEDRVGLIFQALYSETESGVGNTSVSVRGEVHSRSGDKISRDAKLIISAYDGRNQVMGTTSSYVSADSFFGFETFAMTLYELPGQPVRIRLFPKFS